MDRHLLLSFGTTQMRTRTLRINNVAQTLTDFAVRGAMTGMIQSQSVASAASGAILINRRAQLVTRSVKSFDLSA